VSTLVAPGIHRITTPLGGRPSSVHANLVELEGGGWLLVDGGADTVDAWAALDEGVREVAGAWSRVAAHLVTHMHLDHVGLVARVRRASGGAPLLMGRLDAERRAHAAAHPAEEAAYRARLLRENGAPSEVVEAIGRPPQGTGERVEIVAVDHALGGEGGAIPGAAGWRWIWTPGHTAGHLSLFRSSDDTLIAGDAVLPRITPTLGVNRQRADPVGDYLDALDRIDAATPVLVLPGHGAPIHEAARRTAELREATLAEARAVEALLSGEPRSAWELAARRYAGRDLPLAVRMLALRELLAHLHRLAALGAAAAVTAPDGVARYASA
jgi:glyoxylase-like metal-dependent hydrolase (beta-lactamase superfamily II)